MTFGDRLPVGHPTGALAVLDKLHHSATNLFAPSVVSQVFGPEAKVLVETQRHLSISIYIYICQIQAKITSSSILSPRFLGS